MDTQQRERIALRGDIAEENRQRRLAKRRKQRLAQPSTTPLSSAGLLMSLERWLCRFIPC